MKTLCGLLALLLTVILLRSMPGSESPKTARALTAEESKEVDRLTSEGDVHADAGRFEEAVKAAQRVVVYRAERQGKQHWEVIDARLMVERWQRFTGVAAKDRAEVVRGRRADAEGWQLLQRGRYREAEGKLREALDAYRKVLGEQHLITAQSCTAVASSLASQGNYPAAVALHQKALACFRKELGEQHPDTATSCNDLAFCLHSLGKMAEAQALFQKALDVRLEVLGAGHPHTARSCNNVAFSLHNQGKLAEAQVLYQQSLELHRKVFGEQHPDTATSCNNLASCLNDQGQNAEALPLYHKALDIQRKVLGEEHPDTALSCNNVAYCLNSLGKHAEALPLYHKALVIRRQVLGEQHPDTAQSYNNLANCLDGQGKHAEALPLYSKALDILRSALGEQHPSSATCLSNVAVCLNGLGQHAEALPLHRKGLDFHRQVLGEQHPLTARSCNNVAGCLVRQRKFAEALPLFEKALAIRLEVLGEQHPDTAFSYHNVAGCLIEQGKLTEALPLFQKALDRRRQLLGEQHPDTAQSYDNVAYCLYNQGQHAEAARHWEKALVGQEFGRLQASRTGFERTLFRTELSPRAALAVTLVRLDQPVQAWQHAEADLAARGLLDDLGPAAIETAEAGKRARLSSLAASLLPLLSRGMLTAAERRQRDALTRDRDELLAELARRAVLRTRARVLPLKDIRKQIPADAAVVFWLDEIGQHLGCVLRREGDPAWVRLPGSGKDGTWTEEDNSLPERALASFEDTSGNAATRRQLVARLHRQRIAPLETHLQGVRLLLIVPVGQMAKVPVEAVADRYTVSYVPSASVHARGMEQHRPLEASSLLVLADPVFTRTAPEPPRAPGHGLLVKAVTPGGLAARIGLRPGDVLLEYADRKLTAADDLMPAKGDERVPLKLWREGKEMAGRIPAGDLGVVIDRRPVAEALAEWRKGEASLMALGRGEQWQALPGTRLEARTLAGLVPRTTALLGSEASEKRLDVLARQGKLKDYRLLHLATHGQANESRPELTALVLAQDGLPTPDEAAALVLKGERPPEGKLTVGRMLQKDWQLDADLVVLSACQSGLGKRTRGEGMLGFTQALLQKGARSVVLSRWKVDDSATALLMGRFYENLLGKRDGLKEAMKRAEALTEAKVWLRNLSRTEAEKRLAALVDGVPRGERGSIKAALPPRKAEDPKDADRPFAHPYYWAAFVLLGDPN